MVLHVLAGLLLAALLSACAPTERWKRVRGCRAGPRDEAGAALHARPLRPYDGWDKGLFALCEGVEDEGFELVYAEDFPAFGALNENGAERTSARST